MNNSQSIIDKDTTPWYKQFWPWFIIALPASSVIAGLTTLFIANEHADSLVTDDYYKKGLAINYHSAKLDKAIELGYQANLMILADNYLVLSFTENRPDTDSLTVNFVHPGESNKDFSVQLTRVSENNYQAKSPIAIEGKWYLNLTDNDSWLIKATRTAGQAEVAFTTTLAK